MTTARGPLLIVPRRHADARGWFVETWSAHRYRDIGIDLDFVQDNQSYSSAAGTVRGLHFQAPPHAQAKLVRCVAGAVMDVLVDVRSTSPTYGRSLTVTLTAEGGEQVFVPEGLAHGFMTLRPDTQVAYRVSAAYRPDAERGLDMRDPSLGLKTGASDDVAISDRDRSWPGLAQLTSPFIDTPDYPFVLDRVVL